MQDLVQSNAPLSAARQVQHTRALRVAVALGGLLVQAVELELLSLCHLGGAVLGKIADDLDSLLELSVTHDDEVGSRTGKPNSNDAIVPDSMPTHCPMRRILDQNPGLPNRILQFLIPLRACKTNLVGYDLLVYVVHVTSPGT